MVGTLAVVGARRIGPRVRVDRHQSPSSVVAAPLTTTQPPAPTWAAVPLASLLIQACQFDDNSWRPAVAYRAGRRVRVVRTAGLGDPARGREDPSYPVMSPGAVVGVRRCTTRVLEVNG